MTAASAARTGLTRRQVPSLLCLAALAVPALASLLAALTVALRTQPTAVPLPLPVYEIESVSGAHRASLLNLPLGQPGVLPQAPIPVDIDGDLLPDVTVAVNLVNVDGLLLNPPQPGQVLAPNIEINRLVTAPLLGQPGKPLRINVKLTVKDLQGTQPDTVVRFGYDTGPGGSIPTYWKAKVAGLDKFFNPFQAVIDTEGQDLGLSPGISDFRLAPIASPYQGPLSIIGGVKSGDVDAALDLRYSPFPGAVQVTYGSDDAGAHATYAHGAPGEVDLAAKVRLDTEDQVLDATARFDRLPRAIAVDFGGDLTGGTMDFRTRPDGRLPDVGVDVATTPKPPSPVQTPLVAHADVEALPAQLHGEWNVDTDSGEAHAAFSGSGSGVGAIEASVANFAGPPRHLVPWVPEQQQYLSFEQLPVPGGDATEQLLRARVERIRSVTFDQDGAGYRANAKIGDGELPLQAHVTIDLREEGGPLVDAEAQIAPLPDSIDLRFSPPGDDPAAEPLVARYEASQTVDVDVDAEVRLPVAAAGAACGANGTVCARLGLRNIPAVIEARVYDGLVAAGGHRESRIEVDTEPRPGGVVPDLLADVVLGQDDTAPLVAHAEVDGLSRHLRVRTLQGASQTLQRLELHTCDRRYEDFTCAPGSEDEIGSVRFAVKDFLERPANLPPPTSSAPLFAGVTARGDLSRDDLVRFEAVGRVTNIREVQYVNDGDAFGVKSRIGGGKDLVVDVDGKDLALSGITPAGTRADVAARALISPLPDDMTFCFRRADSPLTASSEPVTAACNTTNPFGDGTVTSSPLTLAFRSSAVFRTEVEASGKLDQATRADATDDIRAAAKLRVERIPNDITARVGTPKPRTNAPIRILTTAPAGADIDLNLHGELAVGGASCNEPDPAGDLACADLDVDDLPLNLSALVGGARHGARAEFHACDYRFFHPIPGCVTPPGQIKALTADGKIVVGNPGALDALDPETDLHALLQARMPSDDDLAFRARARFERIRSVFFRQAADGFDAGYELGDGIKPFEAKATLDTRSGIGGPNPTGIALTGKARLTPLPSRVIVGQHGPGDGPLAAPMRLSYDASSDVDLDAFANVVSATSPAGATCGAPATACATLDIDNIPAEFVATVGTSATPPVAGALDHRTTIKTAYANANGLDKIDVRAEAILGLPSTTPLTGATPVRAKVDLLGLPRFVTAALDEHVKGAGTAREGRDLQRVAVQTCDVLANGLCRAGTEDQLDTLHLEAGTYLTRPLGMPAPGAGIASPLWAHVVGRGNAFQAGLHLRTLRELQYVSDSARGLTAARARIGQDDQLTAKVDVLGLPLGPQIVLGSLAVDEPTLDLQATAVITNLPDTVGVCLRSSGQPVPAPTGNPITAPCEDANPFEDGAPLPHSPLSVAYRASDPISRIAVDATATTRGRYNARPGQPPIEPRTLAGSVTVDNVPRDLTLHVLTPADDAAGNPKGATKVRYEAPNPGGPGMTIGLRAAETVGDAICQDPRPTATALCVGATLRDLPQVANLRWEPEQQSDNFELTTDSTSPGGAFSLDDLELSSVKPRLGPGAVPVVPATADVLILTGAVRGIDHNVAVNGNLGLPTATGDTGAIDLRADVRIGEITAAVRNFVAPNPFVGTVPARPVFNDPASPWVTDPSLLQTATFRQRGEAFLAEASIKQVAGFGYRAVTDTAGQATGTSVVTVDFAKDFAARAYADIAPDDTTRIVGDVLLEDIPAGLSFCFRGARTGTPTVAAAQASYCDDPGTGIRPEDGAFQFLGTPSTPELDPLDPDGLDVDAFVRVAANGTDILSGRLDVADIPYRLEGAIPAGGGQKLDVAAKKRNGTADGINEIKFAFATFDLPPDAATTPASIPVELRSGYTATQPGYSPITTAKAPFPPKVEPGQYLSAVSAFGDVEVAGRIGGFGGPASRLQRLLYDPAPCANPGGRTDYPFFPRTDGSSYKCVRADLQQTSATADPLALSAISRDATGAEVRLTNAGIDDLPAYIQLTLSETDKTGPGDSDVLRRRCRPNQVETAGKTPVQVAAITDCMPPLVRFDQPLDSARVFGVLEAGTPEDLAFLSTISAREALADTKALPTTAGWADWSDSGSDPTGVRVRLAERAGGTAVRASLRLPIPASLTIAHPQSAENEQADATAYYTASDTRLHYVVRTSTGVPVESLGEMAGLIQQADGTQILIGQPCAKLPQERKWSLDEELGKFNFLPDIERYSCDGDLRRGVAIPGEVGLSLYDRTNKKTGTSFLRVDGRVSTPISAGIRLLGGDPTGIGRLEAEVKDVPGAVDPATGLAYPGIGPDDATFRLQHMSLGKGEEPPEGGGGGGGGGEAVDEPCIFCTETNVRLASVFASFDFQPDGASQPARRVDATLRSDGLKNGLEVKSTNAVVGGVATPVRVVADAKVDPLDFRAYLDLVPLFDQAALDLKNFIKNDLGLPGWIASVIGFVVKIVLRLIASLVNVRVELQSKLEAGLDIMTSHLQLRQNLFHVKAQVDDGSAQLGPFDLYVKQLEAFASVGARIPLPWPLPDITIGFTLLSVYYLPAFSDLIPFDLKFINCDNAVTAIVDNFLPNAPPPFFPNSFEATPGDPANIVIWPFRDPRMSYGGLLGPLVQLGAMLAGPFFCLAGVSNEDIPLGRPADPVGESLWAGHRVFDSALLDPSTLTPGAPAADQPPDPVPSPPAPPAPAPLPDPEPDYTLIGNLALCGLIDVGTLTIPSGRTLRVATAADATVTIPSRSGQPAKPNCVAADVGSLTIVATRIVNHGTINATGTSSVARQPQGGDNPVFTGNPPSGNGGGGHHGAGGNGSTGSGGQAYTNPGGRTSSVTETGVPGAGSGRGNGGGVLQLLVSPRPTRLDPAQPAVTYVDGDITSTGTIRADGREAANDFTGTCGVVDNPSTPANEAVPLSGNHGPGGGGSGGGIVLAASRLALSGPVQARGGPGGFGRRGGGGGGGGGVVKLLAPVQVLTAGFAVDVAGGARGGACTSGNLPNPAPFLGVAGAGGDRVDVARPLGSAQETADFWNRGTVRVPIRAEGSYSGASPSGFTVTICGIRATTGSPPADPDPTDDDVPTLADNYTVPTNNTTASPCGSGGGTQQLASKSFSVFSIEPTAANGFVNVPLSGTGNDGYWGVWAAVVRGTDVSKAPTEVHTVFGVDNTAPTVAITAPAADFETREVGITLAFDQADPAAAGDPSGLAATECRNDGPTTTTQFAACAPGGTFNLTPGDGDKRIRVRVTDVAGNSAEATVDGTLSNSPPTATASVSAGPDGTNSFYRTAPSFTVNGYSQSQGIPAHATEPVFWSFDDLPEQPCALPCTIPGSEFAKLPPGDHALFFSAQDRLGNRLFGDQMQRFPVSPGVVKWDPNAPRSELTLVPRLPDAEFPAGTGWFTDRPFVVLSAIDGFGESGLQRIEHRLDGVGSFATYTGPFELTPGTHSVEWRAVDRAGNVQATQVRSGIRVDDLAPDVDVTVAGGTAGLNGWFTSAPTVTVGGFADNAGGVGPPLAGRIRHRVDNGAEQSCSPSCSLPPLGTGSHLIGAYGVDAVGNAGSEAEADGNVTVKVDGEAPSTQISIRSLVPDGLNGWHRSSLPWVTLTGIDQPAGYGRVLPVGSGVARTERSLDGGTTWSLYTGPFAVSGGQLVCARSIDVAGNVEVAGNCRTVKGDDVKPTVGLSVSGPPGLAGWYVGPATVTVSSADTGGSGLVTPGATGTPCWWTPPAAPVPAGTCASIDGRPFLPVTGPLALGEGRHEVRAFSVDAAGNRSDVAVTLVDIDLSPAKAAVRTVPPTARSTGWFRTNPRLFLRTVDGAQGSGVARTELSLDGGATWASYTGPASIPAGRRVVAFRTVDVAGLASAPVTLPLDVDTTPPTARATSAQPSIWLRLLGVLSNLLGLSPSQAKLRWEISDDLAPSAKVKVIVYNQTGNVVRVLDGGSVALTPGVKTSGHTLWDGKDQSLTGIVPLGLYYYRVVVTDAAGNISQSSESVPITIKVG